MKELIVIICTINISIIGFSIKHNYDLNSEKLTQQELVKDIELSEKENTL